MPEERQLTAAHAEHLKAAGALSIDPGSGRQCFNVPAFFPFSQDLTAGQSRLDLSQTVDSDADFYWRGWRYVNSGGGYLLLVRFRLLSGYYLSNTVFPIEHLSMRAITSELRINAGGFVGIEATNNDVSTRRLKIVLFGVKRYFVD